MSEFYTKQELQALDKVMEVFGSYIAQAKSFSVVWSKQAGYLFMNLDSDGEVAPEPAVMGSAEELSLRLFREVAKDVLAEQGACDAEPSAASEADKMRIRQRLDPYLEALPEYRPLAEKLF